MGKLKIFIDTRVKNSHPHRGISRNLELYIDVLQCDAEMFEVFCFNGFIRKSKATGILGFLLYVLEEQLFLPIFLLFKRFDVVIFPNQTAPLLPIIGERIMLIHDMMFLQNLRKYGFRGQMFLSSLYRSVCVLWLLHYYKVRILTISNTSRLEILKYVVRARDEIHVIPCAINFDNVKNQPELNVVKGAEFIFTVSGAAEHKNFRQLSEVVTHQMEEDVKLVCVGDVKLNSEDTKKIYQMNNISDEEIASLFSNCKFFCFASLEEGFGIPLLEAIKYNKLICCSDIPIFREILGEKAVFFDPTSSESINVALATAWRSSSHNFHYGDQIARYSSNIVKKQIRDYFVAIAGR